MTVSEDSLTVTYANEISFMQAWKKELPGIILIGAFIVISLVISFIWLDTKAIICFSIMACIGASIFIYIAIAEVKHSKNFRFVLDENGVTVFGQGKRSFIDWKNVAVAVFGSFFTGSMDCIYNLFYIPKV